MQAHHTSAVAPREEPRGRGPQPSPLRSGNLRGLGDSRGADAVLEDVPRVSRPPPSHPAQQPRVSSKEVAIKAATEAAARDALLQAQERELRLVREVEELQQKTEQVEKTIQVLRDELFGRGYNDPGLKATVSSLRYELDIKSGVTQPVLDRLIAEAKTELAHHEIGRLHTELADRITILESRLAERVAACVGDTFVQIDAFHKLDERIRTCESSANGGMQALRETGALDERLNMIEADMQTGVGIDGAALDDLVKTQLVETTALRGRIEEALTGRLDQAFKYFEEGQSRRSDEEVRLRALETRLDESETRRTELLREHLVETSALRGRLAQVSEARMALAQRMERLEAELRAERSRRGLDSGVLQQKVRQLTECKERVALSKLLTAWRYAVGPASVANRQPATQAGRLAAAGFALAADASTCADDIVADARAAADVHAVPAGGGHTSVGDRGGRS